MRNMFEKSVPASMEYMDAVLEEMEQYLAERRCPPEIATKLEIALEEIFTNVASYAYHEEAGEFQLSCMLEQGSGELKIQFKDSGIPFNPLEKPEPDLKVSFDKRPIGGLGIYMVKMFADEAEYEYKDGCNILTIKKNIRPE